MELFTLGRGNYTEHDVKEAARAFTGWSATIKGDYIFRKISMILEARQCLEKPGILTAKKY